ncbi:MAG TPA: c-type cytochrome [Sulfuricaulis sp.]
MTSEMRKTLVLGAGLWAMALAMGGAQAAGDAAAGKGKSAGCAGCHGAQGEGKDKYPALAGKDAAFLVKQMQDFRSGTRQDPGKMMNMMAKPLSDQDIANLAAYYASLKGK